MQTPSKLNEAEKSPNAWWIGVPMRSYLAVNVHRRNHDSINIYRVSTVYDYDLGTVHNHWQWPPKNDMSPVAQLIDTYWSNVDEVIGFLFSIDPMFCYNLNLPSGRHSPVRNKANRYFQSTVAKSAKPLRSAVDLHKLGCNAQTLTICCHACCQDFRATFYLDAGRLVKKVLKRNWSRMLPNF